jgi:benzoyl-CoA 2,3-dioxygenase component B
MTTVDPSGKLTQQEVPLRNAMNEVLRDQYVHDCQRAVDKWNRILEREGVSGFRFRLPSRRFHRQTGIYAGYHFDVNGNPLLREEWERRKGEWLPNEADELYVQSLMQRPVFEPGKMANWIAPPPRGIKGRPVEFEYVKRQDQ